MIGALDLRRNGIDQGKKDLPFEGLAPIKTAARSTLINQINKAHKMLTTTVDRPKYLVLEDTQGYLISFETFIGEDHDDISDERKVEVETLLNDHRKYRSYGDIKDCMKHLIPILEKKKDNLEAKKPKERTGFATQKSCMDSLIQSNRSGSFIPPHVEGDACRAKALNQTPLNKEASFG
jgi:hypothetical protein